MIFMNYRAMLFFFVCLGLLSLGVRLCLSLNEKRSTLGTSFRVLAAVSVMGLSCLSFLLFGCGMLMNTSSNPIFSPDHRYAIRLTDSDQGATGGSTSVEVFWSHGLRSETIFTGREKQVEAKDIRWLNNSTILLPYYLPTGAYPPETCKGFSEVKVSCVPVSGSARQ